MHEVSRNPSLVRNTAIYLSPTTRHLARLLPAAGCCAREKPQFWTKPSPAPTKEEIEKAETEALKKQLLEAVQPTRRGISTTAEQREGIDRLIAELEPC